jgi:hypothetical protein
MVILSNVILDSSYWLNVTGKTFMSGTLVCGSFPTMEYFGTLDLAIIVMLMNVMNMVLYRILNWVWCAYTNFSNALLLIIWIIQTILVIGIGGYYRKISEESTQ